ncbi:Uncharacterised protein [Mycobacteroides abscessus subsp. abscessus]|nr:Uncharacterised protein [Mycobacteroides abscessus subsp. abscessus]
MRSTRPLRSSADSSRETVDRASDVASTTSVYEIGSSAVTTRERISAARSIDCVPLLILLSSVGESSAVRASALRRPSPYRTVRTGRVVVVIGRDLRSPRRCRPRSAVPAEATARSQRLRTGARGRAGRRRRRRGRRARARRCGHRPSPRPS